MALSASLSIKIAAFVCVRNQPRALARRRPFLAAAPTPKQRSARQHTRRREDEQLNDREEGSSNEELAPADCAAAA